MASTCVGPIEPAITNPLVAEIWFADIFALNLNYYRHITGGLKPQYVLFT